MRAAPENRAKGRVSSPQQNPDLFAPFGIDTRRMKPKHITKNTDPHPLKAADYLGDPSVRAQPSQARNAPIRI